MDKVYPFNFNHEINSLFKPSLSLIKLKEYTNNKGNSIKARINALIKFNKGTPFDFNIIYIKTNIIKSSVYKLKLKLYYKVKF